MIGTIIEGAKTKKEILRRLSKAGFLYEDVSEEYGYMNIRIPFPGGYYRIYKSLRDGKIKTQRWGETKFVWSGIPVFEPSGRRSF